MGSALLSVDDFVNLLKKLKKDNKIDYIFFSTQLDGQCMAPSKKNPNYRMSFGISKELFPKKNQERMLGELTCKFIKFAVVCLNKKDINPKLLEEKK